MQQRVEVSGRSNTVVQIVGDGNSVISGHPHLLLSQYLTRRQVHRELDRLSPYTRSTELVGRATELASLQAFLESPRPMAARVLMGSAGSGKTRLALELCEFASSQGWSAGFVSRTELQRFFAQQNLSEWGWCRPTLIVVDYAAEHAELLGRWLDELADRAELPKTPLRLLLLERHASTETGWWTTAFASGGYGVSSKRALLDPVEPVPLLPLERVQDRLALLKQVIGQGNSGSAVSNALEDEALPSKLMQPDWGGDPLFLMMAALEMRRAGHAKALTLSYVELAHGLAEREASRLQELARARSCDPALVQHLAACVTLAQGLGRVEFEEFAAAEKTAVHRPSGGDAAQLADVLQEALPRSEGEGIAPLLPDMIGEALVLRAMRQQAGTLAVLRCHAAFGRPVVQSVIRCAQDFAHEERSRAALEWLAAIANAIDRDEASLAALAESLPVESVVLRDVNLNVAQRLYDLHQKLKKNMPVPSRASSLAGLAIARAMLGQREAALQASQESVNLYRELAAQRPGAFRPKLAASLNNLASRFSDLGQREAALQAAQESVDLYRALTARWPDAFQPDLAGSLTNLANSFSDLGQREAALQAAQESVDLYRAPAAQRPDTFRPALAGSLNNLANRLSELGQREAALQAAQESVDLYREIAAQRPDAFRPDMALSLTTLANRLSELGQRDAALQAVQESADIRRALATRQPDAFRPDLALSLNNLANMRSALGQHEAALQAVQESVDIRRALATRRPDTFRPDLALSLNTLAAMRSALGQRETALQAAQESVDIRRALATRRPYRFRPDLALSLNTLAAMRSALGQHEAALQAAQESVDLYRALTAQWPDAFQPELARSLILLALHNREVGNTSSAVPLAREAITTLQPAFLRYLDVHAPLMLAIVRNYLQMCESIGQTPDQQLLQPLRSYLNRGLDDA